MPARWPPTWASASNCCVSPPSWRATKKTLAEVFAGQKENVTEENIQSRARGNLLMALSNKFGALVLSTGNKSELGRWLLHSLWRHGGWAGRDLRRPQDPGVSPGSLRQFEAPVIPQASLEKPPSAELRPDQKDSDSLPPYEILDPILEDYVEESHTAEQIASDHGFDLALVSASFRWSMEASTSASRPLRDLRFPPKLSVTAGAFPLPPKLKCKINALPGRLLWRGFAANLLLDLRKAGMRSLLCMWASVVSGTVSRGSTKRRPPRQGGGHHAILSPSSRRAFPPRKPSMLFCSRCSAMTPP